MLRFFSVFKYLFSRKKEFYIELVKILHFLPRKISNYEQAFIHKSSSLKATDGKHLNNERLEYLGDAILGSVIAAYLFKKYPDKDEGFLTQMRSRIVNGEKLSNLAVLMHIDKLVKSRAQATLGKKNLYGDAFEALLGAIYLDIGYRRTQKFILKRIVGKHIDVIKLTTEDTNYKSQLLEWCQKQKKELEFYTDQDPYQENFFISMVSIDKKTYSTGEGRSKKEAEQSASKATLLDLDEL
jgi:ribonuclease-3